MSSEANDTALPVHKNLEPSENRYTSNTSIDNIGKYRLVKTIGKGNFAKVKLAIHSLTKKEVAVKIVDKSKLNASGIIKLVREVRILKMLDHPNIVKLLEVIETEKTLYLVMEYCSGGEVFDYLVAHGKMKEKEARIKFRQIISAVHYCHERHVIHRDLKAENLLLDSELNIKIADFGFSNEYSPGGKLDTFCGSPPYAAPELFQGRKYEGPEVDIWSLGVILYTLVSGMLPFDGQNLRELREHVLKGKFRVPFYMSTDCESLIRRMLVLNPQRRATMESVMLDKWVNTGFENERLKPYTCPKITDIDQERVDILVRMQFPLEKIMQSLTKNAYDSITATYLLLDKEKFGPIDNILSYNPDPDLGATKNYIEDASGNSPQKTEEFSRENFFQGVKNNDIQNITKRTYLNSQNEKNSPKIRNAQTTYADKQESDLPAVNYRDRAKTDVSRNKNEDNSNNEKRSRTPTIFGRFINFMVGRTSDTPPVENSKKSTPTRDSGVESGTASGAHTPVKPQSPNHDKLPSRTFVINFISTNHLNPDDLLIEIIRVLKEFNIMYEYREFYYFKCIFDPSIHSNTPDDRQTQRFYANKIVEFEIELFWNQIKKKICYKIKRLSGDSIVHKNIANKITTQVRKFSLF